MERAVDPVIPCTITLVFLSINTLILVLPSFPYASLTSLTIFCAPSAIVAAGSIANPESFKIFLPNSTFVPSRRTTSGKVKSTSLQLQRYLLR